MRRSSPPGPEEVEEVFRVLAGENGVSLDDWEIDEQRLSDSGAPGTRALPVTLLGSTFTRRDAISAVARAFDVTPDEAAALTARFLEREGVVRVLADPDAGTEHIRTRSGHVVPATSGDRRYTTTELLAAEQRIIGSAAARIGEGTGRVAPDMVEHVLGLHAHLDGEQADGVRALLTSGNGYDLVIGQAGTGKTTHARCRPDRLGGGRIPGHRHGGGGADGRRPRGRHRASPARRSPSSWPICGKPVGSPPAT